MKYHVNSAGEIGECSATIKCRFGEENHYDSPVAARKAFEAKNPTFKQASVAKLEKLKASHRKASESLDKAEMALNSLAIYEGLPTKEGERYQAARERYQRAIQKKAELSAKISLLESTEE